MHAPRTELKTKLTMLLTESVSRTDTIKLIKLLLNLSQRSELKSRVGKDPVPGGGDVRRLMAELCILPLSTIEQNTFKT
jgi:hypothetical protein